MKNPIQITFTLTGKLRMDLKDLEQFHFAERSQAAALNPKHSMPDQKDQSDKTPFIDEKELLARLPISRRTLFTWRMTGKIPYVRLTGKRILFHGPSVESALLRWQGGGQS